MIAVTRRDSPLAKASSILIGLDIPDDDRRFEIPNRSRYGQLYMLDCLATLSGRASRQARRTKAAKGPGDFAILARRHQAAAVRGLIRVG